jgi:hypothetical protein
MSRAAEIYIGEDRIVLQPSDQVVPNSGHRSGSPVRTLSNSASVESILTAVLQALADSKEVEGLVADAKGLLKPLLIATGEKTWNAVSRAFAYVGAHEEGDDGLVFFSGFPEKGAFLFRTEAHWRCRKSSREDMAAAFRAAAAVAIEEQNLGNRPPLP